MIEQTLERKFRGILSKAFRTIIEEKTEKAIEELKIKLTEESILISQKVCEAYKIQNNTNGIKFIIDEELSTKQKSIGELEEVIKKRDAEIQELKNKLAMYLPKF